MRRMAFYGKGGIGKSTIVSNLSAGLAVKKQKVLHIGCDPKHDSTRSLVHGKRHATAVELLIEKTAEGIEVNDIVKVGYKGIDCIEVGGPEPGAGCAGLGIIKTLQLVQNLKIFDRPYDYVLFDVLGDVVCGGFATPMRLGFAKEVYVVISSEMMALYAANNICRGIRRYAVSGEVRLGGFIGNLRSSAGKPALLEKFAARLSSKLIHVVQWSEEILRAEREKKTLLEFAPKSDAAKQFRELTKKIASNNNLTIPTPMTDEEFENFFVEGMGVF